MGISLKPWKERRHNVQDTLNECVIYVALTLKLASAAGAFTAQMFGPGDALLYLLAATFVANMLMCSYSAISESRILYAKFKSGELFSSLRAKIEAPLSDAEKELKKKERYRQGDEVDGAADSALASRKIKLMQQ